MTTQNTVEFTKNAPSQLDVLDALEELAKVARRFGHDWAVRLGRADFVMARDAVENGEGAMSALTALYDESLAGDVWPTLAGLAPSLGHTTASGRTSWEVYGWTRAGATLPWVPQFRVTITRAGGVPVFDAFLSKNHVTYDPTMTLKVYRESKPAQRHVMALWQVVSALTTQEAAFCWLADLYAVSASDTVDNPEWAGRGWGRHCLIFDAPAEVSADAPAEAPHD